MFQLLHLPQINQHRPATTVSLTGTTTNGAQQPENHTAEAAATALSSSQGSR
jgi:hypothetical protein